MVDHRFWVRRAGWTRVLSVAVLSLALVACGGGDSGDSGGGDENGTTNGTEQAEQAEQSVELDPQAIFLEKGCAECHGEQGEGVGGEPETVAAGTNMVINQFMVRIRKGRGAAMPGYTEEQVTDEQLQALFEWLRAK